jgi:trehalose synthase
VHFAGPHRDDLFPFRGREISGADLAALVRRELIERLTGDAAPYNSTFTTNGIACTTATIIAAVLGHHDLSGLDAGQIEAIKQVHLLLAMFNALQPGVFAISGWDLCGMLTVPRRQIPDLLSSGDTRWIHRGAYDLMDYRPEVTTSPSRIPRGVSLYGSLPRQIDDPRSYVRRLAGILRVRHDHRIASSLQVGVPPTGDPAVLAMIHRLDTGRIQATVLNFSGRTVTDRLAGDHLPAGAPVTDMLTGAPVAEVDDDHGFTIALRPFEGLSLLFDAPPAT